MTKNSLLPNERLDDLQNGYEIIQDPDKFCFGADAVLLSWYTRAQAHERVLDMGCGTGIIPILLRARKKGSHVVGLEIQQDCAQLARRSVIHNHLEEEITIVTGDIKEASAIFGGASFDVVTCNPPYMIDRHGLQNARAEKAIARHEILCTLKDVVSQAASLLRPRGRFYMIHRPFRLGEILPQMVGAGLEPKRMRLVYPYVDKEPNMVLLEGILGGRPRMTVERPLILYREPGIYTQEALDIYYGGGRGGTMGKICPDTRSDV